MMTVVVDEHVLYGVDDDLRGVTGWVQLVGHAVAMLSLPMPASHKGTNARG